ncbi:AraC family transcriptional regulator [Paenibacillus ginsengarvi]|uniref:AraC family transcriptional regulator n=2 Tax=Paenibacillus ginsengarvi TaxID=400777 RepID=A0A3B0CN25_9BACL|nr:AraC family transcriptional regulator [Paenibacillus ginsengarvi]
MSRLSTYVPHDMYYMYWERKEKFLLYEDIDENWTMFAVENGSFYYEIGEEQGTASLGDIVICPPKTPFKRVVISPLSFHNIKIELRRPDRATQPEQHEDPLFPGRKVSIVDLERLRFNFDRLKFPKLRATSSGRRKISHHILDIWYLICEEWDHDNQTLAHGMPHTADDPEMTWAAQEMKRQAFEELQIKQLATALGLTHTQFTIRFKKVYHTTPHKYMTSLRVEKACTLLLETQMNLNQISECCGYQNGYYLNRVFTKEMGITPGKYRKLHQI